MNSIVSFFGVFRFRNYQSLAPEPLVFAFVVLVCKVLILQPVIMPYQPHGVGNTWF